MTTENVRNWLESTGIDYGESLCVGSVDANQDRCIVVYDGKSAGSQKICVGGKAATKYQDKQVSILIHWTDSPVAAEIKAREIYNLFYGLKSTVMDGVKAISADPGSQPEWAGRENGRCEYVVRVKIKYERDDKNA